MSGLWQSAARERRHLTCGKAEAKTISFTVGTVERADFRPGLTSSFCRIAGGFGVSLTQAEEPAGHVGGGWLYLGIPGDGAGAYADEFRSAADHKLQSAFLLHERTTGLGYVLPDGNSAFCVPHHSNTAGTGDEKGNLGQKIFGERLKFGGLRHQAVKKFKTFSCILLMTVLF